MEDCKYCTGMGYKRDCLMGNANDCLYINDDGYLTTDEAFEFEDCKINYCPICGRKLNL